MLRARLRLGAAIIGFLVVLAEFGCALYSIIDAHLRMQALLRSGFIPSFPVPVSPEAKYLPDLLLGLASLTGGLVLYKLFAADHGGAGTLLPSRPWPRSSLSTECP